MKFDQVFIDRVRDANNLVEIISEHTQLRNAGGGRFMGLCPFPDHKEKSASFSVSEDRQLYHCFGCKKSGNIFTFLETFSGLAFPEAIQFLAKRASLPLPEHFDPKAEAHSRKQRTRKDELLRINKLAGYYYFENLKKLSESHLAKLYVETRKIPSEVINLFKVGASGDEWDGLVRFLQTQKVQLSMAEELGLIRTKKSGGYYDVLRGRIIYPIMSQTRDVIGFGGRAYLPDLQPKYLNSPETELFHKSRSLYGLHEAAKYIRSQDQVIIVEGYMDCLALVRAGIKNVVATLGTALTLDHGHLLRKFTQNVIVLFDGDQAGISAAERSLGLLMQQDLLPKGVILPDQQDPDDYLNAHGEEKLKEAVHSATDLFSVVLAEWMKDYRATPGDQMRIIDLSAPVIAAIPSERLKDLYLFEISQRIGQSAQWVQKAFKERKNSQRQTNFVSHIETPKFAPGSLPFEELTHKAMQVFQLKGAPKDEILVFSLALKSAKLLNFLTKEERISYISHAGIREVLEDMLERSRQKPEEFDKLGALIASQIDSPSFVTAYLGYGAQDLDEEGELRLMKDCFKRVRSRFLRGKAQQLSSQMKEGLNPEHLEQIMNIHRDRLSLKKEES